MRIAIFGDTDGIKKLIKYIPKVNISVFICSYSRKQYFKEIEILSEKLSIPFLIQPKYNTLEFKEFIKEFKKLKINLIWSNSYSIIIRKEILQLSTLGGLNIHAAFLPANRGANPIQWAIINRNDFTGVTLHVIDNSIDTGDIVDQIKIPILIKDDWLTLKEKVESQTDFLIKRNYKNILNGNILAKKQDNNLATYNKRRNIDDGFFRWSDPIIDIFNMIRAQIYPLKGAFYLYKNNKKFINEFKTINQLLQTKFNPNSNFYEEKISSNIKISISDKYKINTNIFEEYFKQYFNEFKFDDNSLKDLNFEFISSFEDSNKGNLSINSICWNSKKCILYIFHSKAIDEKNFLRNIEIISKFFYNELNLSTFFIFANKETIETNSSLNPSSLNWKSHNIFQLTNDSKYINFNIKIEN